MAILNIFDDMHRFTFFLLLASLTWWNQNNLQAQSGPADIPDDLGYRGIWFELNQKYPEGDKYSGGLGTYTAKHRPLAIYAEEVDRTYFVYGGTTDSLARHLLCMIGCYDHATGDVLKPTIVCDKEGVDDPHDDPSLMIDSSGYLWVFVSGRGRKRPGFKYRSSRPYDISSFDKISTEEMTYPQIWSNDQGYFHFFTKYTGVRELYYETSKDGRHWTEDIKLSGIIEEGQEKAGHYQVSAVSSGRVGTFFSRHRFGHPDHRTDLYYLESLDFGASWQTILDEPIDIPLTEVSNAAMVNDYFGAHKNVYLKDMAYVDGKPICLYLVSKGHEPGPFNQPYQWMIAQWADKQWKMTKLFTSDHNYDMGSLICTDSAWYIVAPSGDGPQKWAGGGEVFIWVSYDDGNTWQLKSQLTKQSKFNHSYVRSVVNGKAPFEFFWADGHGHALSKSSLYFGDLQGQVYKMPYSMIGATAPSKLP